MIDMSFIRLTIQKTMIENGINQAMLAKQSKVSKSTINGFLSGSKEIISFDSIVRISNVLQIPIEVLLGSNKPLEHKMNTLHDSMQNLPEQEQNKLLKIMRDMVTAFTERK